jgi:hypothetical protein
MSQIHIKDHLITILMLLWVPISTLPGRHHSEINHIQPEVIIHLESNSIYSQVTVSVIAEVDWLAYDCHGKKTVMYCGLSSLFGIIP